MQTQSNCISPIILLTGNRLEFLKNIASLESINLTGNKLQYIILGTISNLNNLRTLVLTHNMISFIETYSFVDLANLQSISLANNSISAISPNTFVNTTKLDYVTFSSNSISTLSAIAWDNFVAPSITLFFRNNLLTSIDSGSFSPLSKVGTLYLDYNQTERIEDNAFPSMQHLDIATNKLTHLNRAIFRGASLEELVLSNNSIYRIDADTFHDLSGLSLLYLDDNKIQGIQKDLFFISNFKLQKNIKHFLFIKSHFSNNIYFQLYPFHFHQRIFAFK